MQACNHRRHQIPWSWATRRHRGSGHPCLEYRLAICSSNQSRGVRHTQSDARVKGTAGAKDVHVGLAVVTLVGLVDIGLGQDDQAGALVVPLELDLVGLEESLLRDRRGKMGDVEDLDLGRHALALRHEDSNVGIATLGQSKVLDTLDAQLVVDGTQVGRLVEVHLVGDGASTELLIESVLQVPASLVLLHELANNLAGGLVVNGTPDLEVLDGITVLVLGGSLPGDDVSAEGRVAQLEDVLGGQSGDCVALSRVDNCHPDDQSVKRDGNGRTCPTYWSGEAQAKKRPSGE